MNAYAVGVANARKRNQFGPQRRGLGASTNQEIQAGSAVAGAAAGAAYGSVVPGIGTAVGAVVGLVAGSLVHQGQGALRAAQAQAIEQGLAQISSANHAGAGIPWMGSASAPGLQQFLQAIMTGGLWMNWDPSLISSPAVNGNWATTFIAAVKAVVQAIVNNPIGAQVSVPIVLSTGAKGVATQNFTFKNPGIAVGPDVIAANIIMGNGGLMYWMIKAIGESDAHASANANNAAAQKVFALMVDHAAYDYTPPPPPVAAPPPAATSAAPPVNAPAQPAPVPVIAQTPSGSPVVAPNDTNALIAQLIAQGQSQQQALAAAMASLQHQGIDTSQPQVQQQLQAAVSPGMSTTTLLIIGGVAVGAVLLMKKS